MQDWFRFGSKAGRFSITRARRHGAGLQRYDAHDRTNKKPVILTCARPNRDAWASKFEELIAERAQLQFGPRIVGWGIRDDGVFYIAEESLKIEPLSTLPLTVSSVLALLHALADELGDFAEDGFMHGALEPGETLGLVDCQPLIYGAGFRQILGCMEGVGVLESEFAAPEMLEGKPWNERADVFSICAILASLWRGRCDPALYWSGLDKIGHTIKQGLMLEENERPGWAPLNHVVAHYMNWMVETTTGEKATKNTALHETIRTQAIAAEWAKVRPSNSLPSEVGSDKHRKDPNQPENQTRRHEFFVDWEIDHEYAFETDGMEVFMCQPFGIADVNVLRRVQPATMDFALVSLSSLKEWKEKRGKTHQRNMPPFIEAGITEHGWVYWVEAYAGAKTLLQWMKESDGARMEQLNASKAILTAGRALEACAAHGLFHGDLEAERDLIFGDDGTLRVLGIGALQAFGMQGIPSKSIYAAPERRAGAAFDHRADIYALAAILCECVTGCVPEPQGYRHPAADLKWWLREVVMIATEKDPAARFGTWADFLAALERCIRAYAKTARKGTKGRAGSSKTATAAKRTGRVPHFQEASPALTPKDSVEVPKPSSSDPTPPPAPQGRPAADSEAAREAEPLANASKGEQGTKGMQDEPMERDTLPSVLFVYPPEAVKRAQDAGARPSKRSSEAISPQGMKRLMAAGFGLLASAACFALFWSAQAPTLSNTPHLENEGPGFESPVVWIPINTAETPRLPTLATSPRGLESRAGLCGVGYCFDDSGRTKEE